MPDTNHPSIMNHYQPEPNQANPQQAAQNLQSQIDQAATQLQPDASAVLTNTATASTPTTSQPLNYPTPPQNQNTNQLTSYFAPTQPGTTTSPLPQLTTQELEHIQEQPAIAKPKPTTSSPLTNLLKYTFLGIGMLAIGLGFGWIMTLII